MMAPLTGQGVTGRDYLDEDICSNDHSVEKCKLMIQNSCLRISDTVYIQIRFTLKLHLKRP